MGGEKEERPSPGPILMLYATCMAFEFSLKGPSSSVSSSIKQERCVFGFQEHHMERVNENTLASQPDRHFCDL